MHSRENMKGGGIAVIYRSHLHVKKYSFNEHTSFEAITINVNITTKSYLSPQSTGHLTLQRNQ